MRRLESLQQRMENLQFTHNYSELKVLISKNNLPQMNSKLEELFDLFLMLWDSLYIQGGVKEIINSMDL
jgi:hypothetical protein